MIPPWLVPVILGIVEGLTEFLPVSSTGHLIITGHALGFTGEFAKTFEIAIQLGAILSVVVYFRKRLLDLAAKVFSDSTARTFVLGVGLAFLPAAFLGLLTHDFIKIYLFSPLTVGGALIVGGFVILAVERWYDGARHHVTVTRLEEVGPKTALWIGAAQCLALFPGVSRSGATILGGLLAGTDRHTAAEFSFFLALPTMFAATIYDTYKNRSLLVEENLTLLALGFGAAFFTAWIVIALFLTYVKRHTFRPFAWYRIVFGGVVLFVFWP